MPLNVHDQLIVTIVDKAAIGALLLFAGFFVNRWLEKFKREQAQLLEAFKNDRSREAEHERWLQARVDDFLSRRGEATAALAKCLATGNHNIAWLTWKAKHDPKGVVDDDSDVYDKEMHSILSEIVALRVVLASIDARQHERLSPLVERLYSKDAEVARLARRSSLEERAQALAGHHEATLKYDVDLLRSALEVVAFIPSVCPPESGGKGPSIRRPVDRA